MAHRIFTALILFSLPVQAVTTKLIDDNSVEFPLGKATRKGLQILEDGTDRGVNLGARLQSSAELRENAGDWTNDFIGRRIRFEFGAQLSKDFVWYMDIRNDRVNQNAAGEGNFVIGDAYLRLKGVFGVPDLSVLAFRGKVDVSRSQTVSSAQLIAYDRTSVADYAASYVSHNRRATNVQLQGTFNEIIRYSVVLGDGVATSAFLDARGRAASSVTRHNPLVGAKVVVSPIPGWEEKDRSQTYFGNGHHIAFGAGYFHLGSIQFLPAAAGTPLTLSRNLLNAEASVAWGPWFLELEFFHFGHMVDNFTSATPAVGTGLGWQLTTEYVLAELSYLAPYFRYEHWNKFRESAGYGFDAWLAGVNWYLRGNTFKIGMNFGKEHSGSSLTAGDVTVARFTSQLHF